MGKKKSNKKGGSPASPAAQPGGDRAGAGFNPADLAEEAPTTAPEGGAVPKGLPISDREYEELQRRARHQKLPRRDRAQEDPSASSGSG